MCRWARPATSGWSPCSRAGKSTRGMSWLEQTEGDPYARGYATLAMEVLLSERLGISRREVFAKIPMMMIGGVGGIMSPHINLFVKQPGGTPGGGKRLALGVASSRERRPRNTARWSRSTS